jgi:cytochrome P450
VRRIGQDWKTFSNAKGYQPNRPEGLPLLMPEESDPPRHTAWRNAINPHLSPKVVAGYEANVRADVNTLIDRFIDKGHCEFISRNSRPDGALTLDSNPVICPKILPKVPPRLSAAHPDTRY